MSKKGKEIVKKTNIIITSNINNIFKTNEIFEEVPVIVEGQIYPVRVLLDDKRRPWFVCIDIAKVIDYKSINHAIDLVRNYQRLTFKEFKDKFWGTLDRDPSNIDDQTNIISESGLYRILIKSNKPRADPFQIWIENDLLPKLNETGFYSLGTKVSEISPEERRENLNKLKKDNNKLDLDNLERITSLLEKMGGLDDRDKLNIKDKTRDILMSCEPSTSSAAPGTSLQAIENDMEEFSISRYIESKFKLKLSAKESNSIYISIGRLAASKYKELYKKVPPKRQQYVGGTIRDVSHYTLGDYKKFIHAIIVKYIKDNKL